MKKNRGKKLFIWLLVLLQLVVCTALADTVINNLTTFNAFEQTGNYTVRFLKQAEQPVSAVEGTQELSAQAENAKAANENVICEFTGSAYETPISDLMAKLPAEYQDTLWSVTPDYLVLNNVDITVQGEKVARLEYPDFSQEYASLQEAINAVPVGSTMESTTVYLLKDAWEDVEILGKSLTLDLGGHTLSSDKSSAIYGKDSNLTIKQGILNGGLYFPGSVAHPTVELHSGQFTGEYLTIQNLTTMVGVNGGGMYLSNVGKARMEHCNVTENRILQGDGSGGGIYLDNSSLTGKDLTVSGNSAIKDGGGIYVSAGSTLSLAESNVSKNSASTGNGGGIYLGGNEPDKPSATFIVNGSTISQNGALKGKGSGIYMAGGSISGSGLTISGDHSHTCSEGGGIYAEGGSINLSNSSIRNNVATKNGGGVYLNGATLNGKELTIDGNEARIGGGAGAGAGIYVGDGGSVTGGIITVSANMANETAAMGAGVYVAKSGSVKASMTISGNKGAKNGGGMYVDGAIVTLLEPSLITGHKDTKNTLMSGAGIYLNGGTLTITGTTISDNTSAWHGSGIYLKGGTLTAENLTVSGNTCKSGDGGGIYAEDSEIIVSDESYFDLLNNNSKKGFGGGLYLSKKNKVSSITGGSLTINENEAMKSGGGAFVDTGCSIESVLKVSGNTASGGEPANGGGINMAKDSVVTALGESFISGNTSAGDGAGIYMASGSTLTPTNKLTISENHSEANGGGIYANGGTITKGEMNITWNEAKYDGGGIYCKNAIVTLENSLIDHNVSVQSGAGIETVGSTVTLTGTTISENTTKEGSAAAIGAQQDDQQQKRSNLTINNCKIINNHAQYGGAICLMRSKLQASGLQLAGNTWDSDHGAVGCLDIQSACTVTLGPDCVIDNNQSCFGGIRLESYYGSLTAVDGLVVSNNTGVYTGGIYASTGNGTLELIGAQFINNNATYVDGTGGMLISRGENENSCVVKECTFSDNEGTTGALRIDATNITTPITITGCTFKANQGTKYAGAIYQGGEYKSFELKIENSCITENTGAIAGGVYATKKITIDNTNIIYGNKSTDGNQGNDIALDANADADIAPAKEMNEAPDCDEYTWIGGTGTTTLPVGEKIISNKPGKPAYYTAGIPRYVAQNTAQPDRPVYLTLQEAIEKADSGDTIALIAEDEGLALPVSESVRLAKEITLDLNGHQLFGTSGVALTIEETGKLTLTGKGQVQGVGDGYAVQNEGELILATDPETTIAGIDHRGSLLFADCPIKVSAIALGDGKVLSGGSKLQFDKLEFVLADEALQRVNAGWKPDEEEVKETLMVPADSAAQLDATLAAASTVRDVNGFVSIEWDENRNLIAHTRKLVGVYLDGQQGSNENTGLTPTSPVLTFEKAVDVLNGLLEDPTLSEIDKSDIQGIYVMDKVVVSNSQDTWSLPEGYRLIRYPDYKGYLVEVTGGLSLNNIVIDGNGDEKIEASSALIKVNSGATLNINDGAVLQKNHHMSNSEEAGGAVYCKGGTVNMNGGSITGNKSWYGGGICLWDATLNMNGGTISNNQALTLGKVRAIGGGVALLSRSTMQMHNGAVISDNMSEHIGGGIAVGGDNNLTTSTKVALAMDGGTISGNSSIQEGGGVFIQAGGTAHISAGQIIRNSAASKGGMFGGGGIYVNGDRGFNLGSGKLYLTNVNISGNHADVAGGGLAACPTSTTAVYVGSGGVIYNNTCYGDPDAGEDGPEIYVDDHIAGGWSGIPVSHISAYMLGGKPYEWKYAKGGDVPPDHLSAGTGSVKLDNPHTKATAISAIQKCSLLIADNRSGERGGGVGSNGFVQIGTPPTDGEWTPEGTKTLTGRDLTKGEFTFKVTEGNQVVSTGINEAAKEGEPARITFQPIRYIGTDLGSKHTYTIAEVDTSKKGTTYDHTSYTVDVTVVEGSNGKLTGYVTSITGGDTVAFKNTYKTTPATARLKVKKTVQGQPVRPETFTFELALKAGQANAKYVTMPASTTVAVQGTGEALFDTITFTKPGDYLFTISERAGSASYQYDKSVWQAAVKVVDENAVLKVASITYSKTGAQNGSAAEFVNLYTPSVATLSLPVTKTISGTTPPSSKTFAFTLTAQNGAPMPQDAQNGTSTLRINGAGQASFGQITYTKAGSYSYVVKENVGSDVGYTYDTKVYNVTVRVADLGGRLSASWTVGGQTMDALSFDNTYQPKAVEVKLPVRKEITGNQRPPETTFTFVLEAVTKDAPMPEQNTVAITGAGNAEFGAIKYTQTGTWTYKLSERNDGARNYDYDNRVYSITVRVTDDNGTLKAAWTTDRGNEITFINDYATPTPTPAPTPTPGPEFTTIRVTKQWQDADDADQIRPATVTVHLERRLAGGEYENVATVALTGTGNTWTYTFDSLPATNERGQRYQYRVREDEVDGYAVQYDGYTITNIHVAVTPTPEGTPMPTPVVVGPTPPGAKGMRYEDGEWIWIDDLGVPLGVVAQTGDNDNLPAVLGGMAVLLVIAGMLVLMIARKKRKDA